MHPLLAFLRRRGRAISRLLILTHDHPDPDAIGSAWALACLGERLGGVRSRIVYGGIIGRMENQTLVRLLRVPIRPVRLQDLEGARHIALVDTQPPFQNNRLPARRWPSLVVDHHPRHPRTRGECLVIDEAAGATTTILSEALRAAGVVPPPGLATAMVYGIGSETQNLGREAGPRDIAAYRACFGRASVGALAKIQNPPRPASFFRVLGRAIHQAFLAGRVIGVHLGRVPSQDIVAHMADFLLTHEQARWSIVTGRYEGRLFVSLRTRNPRAEAGKLLWRLLGRSTAAGGHAMIAGGSVSVGRREPASTWRRAERELTVAFLRSQDHRPPLRLRFPYAGPASKELRP